MSGTKAKRASGAAVDANQGRDSEGGVVRSLMEVFLDSDLLNREGLSWRVAPAISGNEISAQI